VSLELYAFFSTRIFWRSLLTLQFLATGISFAFLQTLLFLIHHAELQGFVSITGVLGVGQARLCSTHRS
jgi:hypothetical protein